MKNKLLHKWRKWQRKRFLKLDHEIYCHFCMKEKGETNFIVAGPSVFICDECIQLCSDILLAGIKAKVADIAKQADEIEQLKKEL